MSNKKNIFDIFKEMNQNDIDNNTKLLQISNNVVGARSVKQGGIIEMGVEKYIATDIAFPTDGNKKIVLLLIIDRDEYERISK